MDGGFIANETYESVSRNFIESNEPTNDMGVIEEYEGEYSIENEFEPFVGQCFLVEKRLSFSIEIMQINICFFNSERSICHKRKRKSKV